MGFADPVGARWEGLDLCGRTQRVTAIMKQDLNGDLSEKALNFGKDELFDFGYSADGRSPAVAV